MPSPRYPKPLTRGDRIVVTAPSAGVPPPLHPRLDLVIGHLRSDGWVVEEGRCLRDQQRGASASADERAAELMEALLRDDVDAIAPPWGGELAIELLDRIDWDALQNVRPKWLLGYSDTSTLLLPITLRLGWATAHGPCLMDLVPAQDDALTKPALAILATPGGGQVLQRQSERWQREWTDFASAPAAPYALTEPTRWTRVDRNGGDDVVARGRLIGGCLDTLMHLAGGPHGDVRAWIAANAADGALLYLENAGLGPPAVLRALHQLRWAGWLDGLQGLLLGRSAGADTSDPRELRYADAIAQALADLPVPVLADVDIGHRPPQFVVINGALGEVRWHADRGGELLQTFG
jgi:muramoyltetrapeptide carboxypeptidase